MGKKVFNINKKYPIFIFLNLTLKRAYTFKDLVLRISFAHESENFITL